MVKPHGWIVIKPVHDSFALPDEDLDIKVTRLKDPVEATRASRLPNPSTSKYATTTDWQQCGNEGTLNVLTGILFSA